MKDGHQDSIEFRPRLVEEITGKMTTSLPIEDFWVPFTLMSKIGMLKKRANTIHVRFVFGGSTITGTFPFDLNDISLEKEYEKTPNTND